MSDPTSVYRSWVAQVESGLGGKKYESLHWTTGDDISVPPLLRVEDSQELAHSRIMSAMFPRLGFAIRELVVAADPRAAATAARWALEQGADEVEFRCDELARDAMSPIGAFDEESDDDPFAVPLPGEGGVAIHTRRDLEAALDRIDLARTSLWFSAGEGALAILAWWIRIARGRRISIDSLRGGVDIDPIDQILARRMLHDDDAQTITSRRTSPQSVFDALSGVMHFVGREAPGLRPLVLDAQSFHLAGAGPALELGLLLASIVETAKALVSRGVSFEVIARHSSVRMQVSHELLTEVAKLRAFRACWYQIARAFGSKSPSEVPHLLSVTSARFRADMIDHEVNLIRSSLAGTTALLGGCDSLIVMPHDGSERSSALDLARNQLHLLRHESLLGGVADPLAGSHAVEVLTDRIARRAWQVMQEVEGVGGFLSAAVSGRVANMIGKSRGTRDSEFAIRRRTLVGINRYADLARNGSDDDVPALDELDAFADAHTDRFENFLDRRRADRAEAHLLALRRCAPSELMSIALGDGADDLSLEELCTARWPSAGNDVVHEHLVFASTDGSAFEELRIAAQEHEGPGVAAPRVVLVTLGSSAAVLAKSEFARDLLRVGGLEPQEVAIDQVESLAAGALSAANAVVIAAEDAEQKAILREFRDSAPRATLVWAGKPAVSVPESCDLVMHRGVNVVEALSALHRRLGIVIADGLDDDEDDIVDHA